MSPSPNSECILIVDDEPANLRLLDKMLHGQGYQNLALVEDPREVLDRYRERGSSVSWWLDPGSEPADLAERLGRHGFVAEEEPTPGMVLDLGDRHVELLEAVLDPAEHHALVLERVRVRNVQFDVEDRDAHARPYAVTATRSIVKTSMTSPTFTSL